MIRTRLLDARQQPLLAYLLLGGTNELAIQLKSILGRLQVLARLFVLCFRVGLAIARRFRIGVASKYAPASPSPSNERGGWRHQKSGRQSAIEAEERMSAKAGRTKAISTAGSVVQYTTV
jgi:hypothetical protein